MAHLEQLISLTRKRLAAAQEELETLRSELKDIQQSLQALQEPLPSSLVQKHIPPLKECQTTVSASPSQGNADKQPSIVSPSPFLAMPVTTPIATLEPVQKQKRPLCSYSSSVLSKRALYAQKNLDAIRSRLASCTTQRARFSLTQRLEKAQDKLAALEFELSQRNESSARTCLSSRERIQLLTDELLQTTYFESTTETLNFFSLMLHGPLDRHQERRLSRQSHAAKSSLTELKRRGIPIPPVAPTPLESLTPQEISTRTLLLEDTIRFLQQLSLKAPLLGLERARLFWCQKELARLSHETTV